MSMTRREAEQKILAHLKEIDKIRMEYCPEDGYLTLCILNGHLSANNSAHNGSHSKPIDFWTKDGIEIMSHTKVKDGSNRYDEWTA